MKNAFYACPYCKEEYANPVDLAHCILSCEEKNRIEEEKQKKEKLVAEKEARKKEVEEAANNYQKLLKAFVNDYGIISIRTDSDSLSFLLEEPFCWWFS